jgi:hypothetical protein
MWGSIPRWLQADTRITKARIAGVGSSIASMLTFPTSGIPASLIWGGSRRRNVPTVSLTVWPRRPPVQHRVDTTMSR